MEEKQKRKTTPTDKEKVNKKRENNTKKQTKTKEKKETVTKKEKVKNDSNTIKKEVNKKTTKQTTEKGANKKQDTNIENKKTSKTKKEPTTTKKNKTVKIEQEPKETIVQEKKEQITELTDTKKEVSKKLQTKKAVEKKENENKEKNADYKEEKIKQKKKHIDITIGSILAVIVIIALIVLNIKLVNHAYNSMNSSDEEANGTSDIKEIGHELGKDDELVQSIIEKITFAPSVTASIYDTGKFEENNIPNTLKLRIGWSLVKGENKLQSINENNETVEMIEQKVMQQSIKDIFGSNVEYKDEQFYNTNVSLFSTYAPNKGMIYYENGYYTNSYTKEEAIKIAPFIYQEVEKVVKYSSAIEVYVKGAYIDTLGDVCMIYKDLENGKLSRRILQINVKELLGEGTVNYSTGEGTISINENTALDNIRKKLNTYKYTLRLDHSTGEFCLSSFERV